MSFLNWMLLGGALAFAAPLLIHLLNRSRFKVVDWGAMHLLEAALQVNSKRIEWQSWLLLFMRCLIPIIFAFALARPVFTSLRSVNADGDKSIVVLIDNSISMQAKTSENETRFDRAIAQVSSVIEQLKPSTELSVWTMGGVSTDVLAGNSFDHRRVLNKLATLRSGAASVPVQSALASAIKHIASMQNASREIILISDFQSHEWQRFDENERTAMKEQLAATSIPIQLTFLPIRDSAATSNLSVAIDPLESPFVVADQVFRITAQVRNHGSQPLNEVPIVLEVAGAEIASRRVSIPSNGTEQAIFECQIPSSGSHVIEVKIEDESGFASDNIASQIVVVREPLRVLVIDERAAESELKRASGYLSLALSPFRADDFGKNLMQARVVAPDRVVRGEVTEHDVVVLADVPRMNDKVAEEIADFVAAGGGLLIFGGNSVDQGWYNSRWGSKSKNALLPAEFRKPTQPISKPSRIGTESQSHPALNALRRTGAADFTTVEFQRWNPLEVTKSSTSNTVTDVLLQLESGDPLLVSKPYGKGHVMVFASSADTSDSNLPLRPVFVPLMQSVVQWLATGAERSLNVLAGQPLMVQFESSEKQPASTEKLKCIVTLPNASQLDVFAVDSQVSFAETAYPGVYSINDSRSEQSTKFAVSASADESQLEFLSDEQLNDTARAIGASIAKDSEQLSALQSLRANGREIWRYMLLGLIVLLFAELWWQQRISRGAL